MFPGPALPTHCESSCVPLARPCSAIFLLFSLLLPTVPDAADGLHLVRRLLDMAAWAGASFSRAVRESFSIDTAPVASWNGFEEASWTATADVEARYRQPLPERLTPQASGASVVLLRCRAYRRASGVLFDLVFRHFRPFFFFWFSARREGVVSCLLASRSISTTEVDSAKPSTSTQTTIAMVSGLRVVTCPVATRADSS